MTALFDLKDHGVTAAEIHHSLPPSALYEHAIRYEKDASIGPRMARWLPVPEQNRPGRLRANRW